MPLGITRAQEGPQRLRCTLLTDGHKDALTRKIIENRRKIMKNRFGEASRSKDNTQGVTVDPKSCQKDGKKGFQETPKAPKRTPEASKGSPKAAQRDPKAGQRPPKVVPRVPKGALPRKGP